MTPMRALLAAVLLSTLTGCALRHELPRDHLQAKLAAQFPIEKAAALWTVRLTDPVLSLDDQNNRIGLELGVVAAGLVPAGTGVGFRTLAGKAGIEGRVEYEQEEGAFYLREPAIRRMEFEAVPAEVEAPLRLAAETAIRIALRDRPIFVLDPKRSDREALIKDHLLRIWVEKDRLVVEYRL